MSEAMPEEPLPGGMPEGMELPKSNVTDAVALAERPAQMPSEEAVREALRDIYDPELFISITELGLVYAVKYLPGDRVRIQMTLTSPACPLGDTLQAQVGQRLTSMPGIAGVELEWVWSPRWDPRAMATEEAKMLLGIY